MNSIFAFFRKFSAFSLTISVFLTLVSIAAIGFSVSADGVTTLRGKNGRLELTFGQLENGLSPFTIRDTQVKRVITKPGPPLWSVELQHTSGKKITLTNTRCGPAETHRLGASFINISWSLDKALGVAVAAEEEESVQHFRVVCSVQLDGPRALLKLRMYNHTTTWSIRSVTFPSIELAQLGKSDEDDALVYPFASGRVVNKPLRKSFFYGDEQNSDCPGKYSSSWANMQFCAYWDKDGGIYIAAEDPLASRKTISLQPADDKASISLNILWPAEDSSIPGNDFEHPGSITLELFEGDWFDAAKLYRKFLMREAHWWPASGAEGRIDTPDWMRDIPVWTRSSLSRKSIEQTIQFAEFMGVPTALQLYRWHQVPFDNDYPHYFPVKDGFRAGVKKLQDAGIRVVPYINARLWDDDTVDFQSYALPAATKNEQGDYYIERYGSGENLVPMCPTTNLWKNTVKSIILELVGPSYNVDGVYLDQVTAMSPVLCFDPSHGHPLGGGHWWMTDGYWPMLEGVQKTMAEKYPDKILTTECNAEPYTHVFDGYLTWHYQYNDMVPLFSAVYGGVIQQFGRSYRGNDSLAHCMKIGQSLVFGEQLGWMSPGIINQKETAEFLRDAVHTRFQLLPFLSHGEMMRPPELMGQVPEVSADWGWIWPDKTDIITVSAVQSGAWKSPEGKIAFIFANVSDEVVSVNWYIDPHIYGLGNVEFTLDSLHDTTESLTVNSTKNIPITLVGHEIVTYITSTAGN
ncbi:DUF6259 domain-containing protein [Candidatus Latescibacterota bacterium]